MIAISAERTTMRALVCHRPADPSRLRCEDAARPLVGDGDVLVRVRASSGNPVDMFGLSAAGYVIRRFKPVVLGTDFAGTVEEVGRSVTGVKPGDDVFGAVRGAFAEYAVFSQGAKGVVRKPAGVTFADAGTLGVAASTALQALRDHGNIEAGQRVLIVGGSGGVGTFLVQIARALGAEVTAVCSTRNAELVRSIGANTVIDYMKEDVTALGGRFDLIVDVAGSHPLRKLMRLLNAGGSFVCVGASAIQHGKGGTFRALARLGGIRLASSRKSEPPVTIFIAKLRSADLEFLGELVATGRVKPVIERTYDLAEAGQALAHLNRGHLQGKLAIAIGA